MPGRTGRHRQVAPFQRDATALGLAAPRQPVAPTAHALRAEAAATLKSAAVPAGFGLGTRFHAMPFNRSITVSGREMPDVPVQPTAEAFEADVTATPNSVPPPAA